MAQPRRIAELERERDIQLLRLKDLESKRYRATMDSAKEILALQIRTQRRHIIDLEAVLGALKAEP